MGIIEFDFSSGGRLGNRIVDLYNCLCFAIKNNYNIIMLNKNNCPEQIVFKNIIINDKNNTNVIPRNKCYYRIKTILDNYQYKQLYNIIKTVRTTNIPYRNNNDLVIHIRSGDCFSKKLNNFCFGTLFFMVPPLIYYKTILDNNSFDNIYMIAEDTANPIINKLLELYPNIHFQLQDLNKDIELLLSVKNVIYSVGSFLNILLFSDNLEKVFEPKYNWDGTNFNVSFSDNEYIYSLYTLKNKNIKFEYIELESYPKTMLATKELTAKFNLLYSYEN
tara:strand:+ start:4881 stop:5708 length:828 start_codon:yes stop_codon:yes gene_type:complete